MRLRDRFFAKGSRVVGCFLADIGPNCVISEARSGRREFLKRYPLALASFVLAVRTRGFRSGKLPTWEQSLQARDLSPTPTCDHGDPTPPLTAGPFYTPNSPQRRSLLAAGTAGPRLVVTGTVRSTSCTPIANALLDFWQADSRGVYDNEGYGLRGHQLTDSEGRYRLETVVPGRYLGRTRHLHVRVVAPGGPMVTTQLYFPGEAANRADWLFRPELLLTVREQDTFMAAEFDFVLATE